MKKQIIISSGLLLALVGAVVLFNFNKYADAAYITGTNLPITANGNDITVAGNVFAGGFFYSASDMRLKEKIAPLSGALEKVQNLNGVSFDWKNNGKKDIGLIAQDVEKVVPELVVTGNDGMKGVKYANVVALLIEAVKEQQVEIDSLKSQLEALK